MTASFAARHRVAVLDAHQEADAASEPVRRRGVATATATPQRPEKPLPLPAAVARFDVEVDVAHLANPLLAVSRLLASEAGACARVTGDEQRLEVLIALPDRTAASRQVAGDWLRWALHNAGVRGQVTVRPDR